LGSRDEVGMMKEKLEGWTEDLLVVVLGSIVWTLIMIFYYTTSCKLSPPDATYEWEELQKFWKDT